MYLNAPVLFLTYRRFDTTEKVFEQIRKAKPRRLYFASNAPNPNRLNDRELVRKVRALIERIDWPCELSTRFLTEHLSVKDSLNLSIDWFFKNEESGIILEDDCLPHPDFFTFCEALLELYKNDERVWAIAGHNFQEGNWRGEGSYYFSRFNHVWGWASWRRAWVKNDPKMQFWPAWKVSKSWKEFWPDLPSRLYWTHILNRMYKNKINTWDYPWTANVWFNNGLTAIPNVNLISNIGFGIDATHTTAENSRWANVPVKNIGKLVHTDLVQPNLVADLYTFNEHYSGKDFRWPRCITILPFKIIRRLYRYLNS